MKTDAIGELGEKLAVKYYRANSYVVLARNYRTRFGEIDIILQKGKYLIFSEVKTRNENSIATPRESVTLAKQRKIIQAAKQYLANLDDEPFVRFDVVEVFICKGKQFRIHCIEDAFALQ